MNSVLTMPRHVFLFECIVRKGGDLNSDIPFSSFQPNLSGSLTQSPEGIPATRLPEAGDSVSHGGSV